MRNVWEVAASGTMQEDSFPAAEKILADIENVLKKDPNLVSFEIIPAQDNENKSPVFHDENSLGLASWSVQPLYCYAYNRLLELRQNKHRREDPGTVSRWLLGTLLLNPDVSTFWNMKRELVKSGRLDPMQELRFVSVVLYYKAKCFEAFAYRRWLIQFLLVESKHQRNDDVEGVLQNEVRVATMAADRYANNCHAWSHREHVVTTFEHLLPSSLGELLQSEWETSMKWCNRHVSDYSGLAYRQFLLKKLLLDRKHKADVSKRREILLEFARTSTRGCNDVFLLHDGTCHEILDLMHGVESPKRTDIDYDRSLIGLSYWAEECLANEEAINMFPGHEALWYHRRFLAYSLVALTRSYTKCSRYDIEETFNPRHSVTPNDIKKTTANVDEYDNSLSLLEVAFRNRNRENITTARRHDDHQTVMAERFVQFLQSIGLDI